MALPLLPTNFIVTVTGADLIFTWTMGTYATSTIIVMSTSDYPSSLIDGTTIFNGAGVTYTLVDGYSDSQQYYFSAWSENAVGYSVDYATTTIGGEGMFLVFLLGLPAILMFVGARSTYWIFKVLAGFAFLPLGFYLNANPITTDTNIITIQWVVILGVVLGCFFWGFWQSRPVSDEKTERFRFPFMKEDEDGSQPSLTKSERLNAYTRKVNDARNGQRPRRM
ncbi:MAG: hypothetical protein WC389_14335 [Lutibacter sp.]|jgi:hypothetical protein